MKVNKTVKFLFFITLCIFSVSTNFVLADQSHGIDAYVTDWKDTNYLIKKVRSDFQPNDSFSFYAYYGASTLTIPFSSIKRIIVTDRILLGHPGDFSEPKHYCSGEITLINDESLQCSWISNGWQGYNNYNGLIYIRENSWKEIKFGRFNNPKKKKRVRLGKPGAYPYTIHVSSLKNKHDANSLTKKLRQKGFQAFVCPTQIPGRGEYHRIFIGCYRTFKETKKAALKLKGVKNLYPLEAKMPYAIQIGTFNSNQEIEKLKADLQSKTYFTYTAPATAANNNTKLLFGAFRTEKETAKYTKKLQNLGFEAKVVKR